MGLREFLAGRGFPTPETAQVKLINHRKGMHDIGDIVRHGWLEIFQGYQNPGVFDGVHYIVSFVGQPGGRARLWGIFQIVGKRPGAEGPLPAGCPHEEWRRYAYFYELRPVPGFEDLEGRLTIRWVGRIWHQWLRDHEIVEILPATTA
jgi:hypothetical protein